MLAAACDVGVDAQGFTTRDERRFTVSGTPEVTLATFDGSIEIRSWDRPEVQVVIERRADTKDEVDSIEIKAEQAGHQISIEARRPTGRQHRIVFGYHVGRSAKLIASVPRLTNVLARSGDGSIVAERIEGRIELRTGDGSVNGDDLKGRLRVHTGDGRVRLSAIDGALNLDTSDGSITVDGRLDELTARSGDGAIRIRARHGSAMTDNWDVTTGDGSIEIELPDRFSADLDAHTGDGRIDVSALSLTVGDKARHTVRGRLGEGGKKLRVRSGDGGIRLRGAMLAEKTDQK